jgi:BRCA1-associated protein
MVAITDVPSDQIPEGILNVARGYKTSIEHIRVVIAAANNNEKEEEEEEKRNCHEQQHQSKTLFSSAITRDKQTNSNNHKKRRYLVLITFSTAQAATLFVKNRNGKPYNSFERDVIASVHHVVKLENEYDDGDENHETEKQATTSVTKITTTTASKRSLMSPFLVMTECSNGSTSGTTKNITLSFDNQNCAVCLESMEFPSVKKGGMADNNNINININNVNKNGSQYGRNKNDITNSSARTSQPLLISASPSSSSIFTTVCNHSFHTECLMQCQDAPCPVCRYDHSGLNDTLSTCHECGTTERIHICLICGVASCWNTIVSPPTTSSSQTRQCNDEHASFVATGSGGTNDEDSSPAIATTFQNDYTTCLNDHSTYATSTRCRGHARNHYNDTLHAYALDTESQHVWDFAGQGYVHRLIENVNDGKIVEIANPQRCIDGVMERLTVPEELSDRQEDEIVHRKLEGYASQYCTLLKSQLEQQRVYYQGVMGKMKKEHKCRNGSDGDQSLADLITALKQDRNQLQQRCISLQKKRQKVSDDVFFLKNMNESLEANKGPMDQQIKLLERQRIETTDMLQRRLPDLENKVMSLMLKLEQGE